MIVTGGSGSLDHPTRPETGFPHPNQAQPGGAPTPVGVFDSGVGGLSVLRALWSELPDVPFIYFADQAHVPYGARSLEEVRRFATHITRFLIAAGAREIVVACNTASAAALHALRSAFPEIAFIGMEPAVKPAAESTRNGVVGVLATPATFQGALYASVIERFAHGVTVLQAAPPGLVEQIEKGALDAPATLSILRAALQPMLAAGIDTLVLGCTHFPFVIPQIEQIVGPQVRVIDPAPAIARQVRRVLTQRGRLAAGAGVTAQTHYITTGDPQDLKRFLEVVLGVQANPDLQLLPRR